MKGSSEGTLPVLSVHAADRDGRGPPYYQAVPEAPTFGEGTYAPDEQQRIQELLNSKLGREHLATRRARDRADRSSRTSRTAPLLAPLYYLNTSALDRAAAAVIPPLLTHPFS